MNIPDYFDENKAQRGGKRECLNEKTIMIRFPEFYNYIIDNYPNDLTWAEKLYWYFYNIIDYPKCHCGNRVKFAGKNRGYYKHCSTKCSNSDDDVKGKKQSTCINNYGVPHQSKSKEIRNKIKNTCNERYGGNAPACSNAVMEKIKQTNLEKYGYEHAMSNPEFATISKHTKYEKYGDENYNNEEKRKNTILERYGVTHYSKSEDFISKFTETNLKKHGVMYPQQSKEIMEKSLQTRRNKMIANYDDVIDALYDERGNPIYVCKCPHLDCNKCCEKTFSIPSYIYYDRVRLNVELCSKLLPVQKSISKGTTIELWVRMLLDSHKIPYETNKRGILKNHELDIYIPSKNIAIECNGCYWHSQKPKKYHYNKFKECQQLGIQLITIWDDQFINKKDIVESIILSKLGIYTNRIYARCCEVREVDSKKCNEFLNNNHIQGKTNSNSKFGLYYQNKLVAIMTFSKKRSLMGNNILNSDEWELSRFCTNLNTQIIGGAQKLLSNFIRTYNPKRIYSFASNDISNGNLYERLGFLKTNESVSYWYIDKKYNRYHRSNFTKSNLEKMGCDVSKTEDQIMRELKYMKIYDSGITKYIFDCK